MKELSIEQKAQRYDEAIKRAKEIYAMFEGMKQGNVLEDVFPELKESEDERIRRWIINEIKIKHHNLDEDNVDFVDKAIAWLEKQGEQKSIVPKFKVGDIIKPKDGGHEPWQVMQVDILDKKYRFKDGYVIHFSQEDDYELVEQKPAWSDEDELQARQIERIVRHDGCTQKLQKQIADWFKSLKDRCAWKPTDLQMEALKDACDEHWEPDGLDPLYTLYQDLKKLTE